MYKEITKEQEEAIINLFEGYFENEVAAREALEYKFEARENGYYISLHQMYEYPKYKNGMSVLQVFQEIADILGCKEGDEIDRWSYGGCETCEYGSDYGFELRFWNP